MGLLVAPAKAIADTLGFSGGGSTAAPQAPATDTSEAISIEEQIYQGLRDRGASHIEAISALSNAGAESGFNLRAFNGEGGGQGAHGLFQWRGDRWNGLQELGKATGRDPYSLDNQLDHYINEVESYESGTRKALEGVTDPLEGAKIFRDKYERPGGHGYGSTASYAKQFANQFSEDGYTPEAQQSRKGSLLTFADGAAQNTGDLNKLLIQQSVKRSDELQKQDPQQLAFTPPPGGYKPAPQLPTGQPMIPNATPFSPGGTTKPGPPASTMSAKAPAAPAAGGAAAPAEPAKDPTFMDKMGKALFPNRDDSTESLKNAMSALGISFGQMSRGQPVNLQPFFEGVAGQKLAVAKQQQQAQKTQIDAMNAQTSAAQAQLAADRLQFDYLKFDDEAQRRDAPVANQDMLQRYAQDEALAPFVGMISSEDEETRKQGVQGLRAALVDKAKAAYAKTADGNYGRLLEEVAKEGPLDMAAIAEIVDEEGLGSEDVTRAFNSLLKQPSAFVKDIDEYLNALREDPERARAMEQAWQRQIGVDETPRVRANRERAWKIEDELDKAAQATYPMQFELENIERITENLIEQGIETGGLNEVLSTASTGIRQAASLVGMDWIVDNTTLASMAQFDEMEASEQALALLIAGPLMEGGGSISDGERKNMLNMVANGQTTPEIRLGMIDKLQAMNKMDQLIAENYAKGLNDDFSNATTHRRDLEAMAGEVAGAISKANQFSTSLKHIDLPGFASTAAMSVEDQVEKLAIPMSQEQYDTFGSALPDFHGGKFWKRKNADGTLTLMRDNEEW